MFLEEGVCYDQCVLLVKLYSPLPSFILYSKAKFVCYSKCFLTSYFCIPVPYNEKDIFFWVLVLKGLVGLHITVQLQLLQCYWLGIELDYCDIEWFALEMNRPPVLPPEKSVHRSERNRTGHRKTDWFQIEKGVRQGCILSPCLFNLYAEYIISFHKPIDQRADRLKTTITEN